MNVLYCMSMSLVCFDSSVFIQTSVLVCVIHVSLVCVHACVCMCVCVCMCLVLRVNAK